jgi:hypothetical protein
MTRTEQAVLRVQKLKAKREADAKKFREQREADTRAIAHARAVQREADRQTLNKRRYRVGALADTAGLFVWEDDTLANLFHLLALLADTPDPVKVLDSLLTDFDPLPIPESNTERR